MENQNMILEARAYLVNAVCAYGEAFGLLTDSDITDDFMAQVEGYAEQLEALMPVLISMYEMTKKLSGDPDLTFMEWLEDVARRMDNKGFGM